MVGGGLAGIAASLALSRRGVQVELLESRRRLGGRTGSFIDVAGSSAEPIDYCQHVGMGCCTNLKLLTQWLGQQDAWTEHQQLHAYSAEGRYQRLSALPFLPAPLHLAGWLARWPGLRMRDRLAIARGMLALGRVRIDASLEPLAALPWLLDHGQTEQSIRNFWNTIIVSALGEEIANVNVASLCKVLQDGFLNHRQAFHLLVPNRPLDALFNTEAHECLSRSGVNIHLATPCVEIVREEGGVRVVSRERSYSAEAVVLAIPWHKLPQIQTDASVPRLPPVADQANKLAASPITGVHTWWDRPWLEHQHAMVVGQLCQWVFAEPAVRPAGAVAGKTESVEHYYQIVISASRNLPHGDPASMQQLISDDLNVVFPAAKKAKLLRLKAVRDPQAVFSVSPTSMQYRAECRALGDDLLLAGDWTRTGWPATMEGAILSGFTAAEALLSRWGCADIIRAPALGS